MPFSTYPATTAYSEHSSLFASGHFTESGSTTNGESYRKEGTTISSAAWPGFSRQWTSLSNQSFSSSRTVRDFYTTSITWVYSSSYSFYEEGYETKNYWSSVTHRTLYTTTYSSGRTGATSGTSTQSNDSTSYRSLGTALASTGTQQWTTSSTETYSVSSSISTTSTSWSFQAFTTSNTGTGTETSDIASWGTTASTTIPTTTNSTATSEATRGITATTATVLPQEWVQYTVSLWPENPFTAVLETTAFGHVAAGSNAVSTTKTSTARPLSVMTGVYPTTTTSFTTRSFTTDTFTTGITTTATHTTESSFFESAETWTTTASSTVTAKSTGTSEYTASTTITQQTAASDAATFTLERAPRTTWTHSTLTSQLVSRVESFWLAGLIGTTASVNTATPFSYNGIRGFSSSTWLSNVGPFSSPSYLFRPTNASYADGVTATWYRSIQDAGSLYAYGNTSSGYTGDGVTAVFPDITGVGQNQYSTNMQGVFGIGRTGTRPVGTDNGFEIGVFSIREGLAFPVSASGVEPAASSSVYWSFSQTTSGQTTSWTDSAGTTTSAESGTFPASQQFFDTVMSGFPREYLRTVDAVATHMDYVPYTGTVTIHAVGAYSTTSFNSTGGASASGTSLFNGSFTVDGGAVYLFKAGKSVRIATSTKYWQ